MLNKFKSFIAWLGGVGCVTFAIWLLMVTGQQPTPAFSTLVAAVILFNTGMFGHYQAWAYFFKE